jgi:hypothetical protein
MMEDPMGQCPSFISCNAPVCPLERIYPSKTRIRFPEEPKCNSHQPVRLRLGKALKYRGLTVAEFNGYASVGGLPAQSEIPEGETMENENQATQMEVFND